MQTPTVTMIKMSAEIESPSRTAVLTHKQEAYRATSNSFMSGGNEHLWSRIDWFDILVV